MAEYIEREQAYQIAKLIVDYIHSDKYHPVNLGAVIMDMIDDIPSADVVPVVHGHWEWADEIFVYGIGYKATGSYRCTACGNCSPHMTNYCPICGADMRGKSDG